MVLASRLQVDDHANPAIQVLPDGRLRVFYAAHYGSVMHYRTTRNPEDITTWDAPSTVPVNSPGTKGYTYPNPLRLSAERTSYLFWRGGNHNPTFSTQADGATTWSPARTLVFVVGPAAVHQVRHERHRHDPLRLHERPSVAVADVNIYYAAYRAGGIFRANGTRIASLGTAIAPSQADKVYDTSRKAWVHDVARDAAGRPVIVFASFASTSDHRYMYARWTGTRWQTCGDHRGRRVDQPRWQGALLLGRDHARSRGSVDRLPVALVSGIYEVETWKTADGGASWSRQAVTSGDTANNVRPISPRGFIPFTGDMSVVWIRGIYNSYVDYRTSVTTILATGGNSPPIADAEASPRTGTAPQQVAFDGRPSRDPDGSVASWNWDFGDGAQGSGAQVTHTYTTPGRYFPKLTVTDNAGANDVFVAEVVVRPSTAPSATTGAASAVTAGGATLSATVNPHNQATSYRFEYGPTTAYGSTTPIRRSAPPTTVRTLSRPPSTGSPPARPTTTGSWRSTRRARRRARTPRSPPRRRRPAPTAMPCWGRPVWSPTGGSASASARWRSTRRGRTRERTAARFTLGEPGRAQRRPGHVGAASTARVAR